MSSDRLLAPAQDEAQDEVPMVVCATNLVLSTVGVSAFALPYSTMQVGWLQASAMLFLCYLLSIYNLYLLDKACRGGCQKEGAATSSYAGVVASILGRRGAYILEALMLLYCFGLLVSYLGTIGKQLSTVIGWAASELAGMNGFGGPSPFRQDCFTVGAAFLVIFPLSLAEQSKIQRLGSIGTVCMFIAAGVVVLSVPWMPTPPFVDACAGGGGAPPPSGERAELVAWVLSASAFFKQAPIFIFAMNGATAFVTIRSKLIATKIEGARSGEDYIASLPPSHKKVQALIWIGMTIALVDYVVCSASGYITFCGDTQDDVLDALPISHWPSLLARTALSVQLTCASAGVYLPLARSALWNLAQGLGADAPESYGRCTLVRLTAPLLAGASMAATALGGALALPLSLTSAICCTGIMFVFPGLCARAVAPKGGSTLQDVIFPCMFACAGLVVGVISTVTIVSEAVS